MCTSQMMAIDAAGGAGKGGVAGTMRANWRDAGGERRERTVVAALCTPTNLLGLPVEVPEATPASKSN
jgi:cytochrome o ubiquinol oxidase subunit 2